jgi:hypothetical protein
VTVTDAAPAPDAVAKERHRLRLEREITALERELIAFGDGLDDEKDARVRERIATGLEVWDLNAERGDLRQRIDHLRNRITLLEQIQRSADDLDRARLVEHQRVLADLNSDRAVARQNEDEAELAVRSAERLLAARQAKREMLTRLRGQLDALSPIDAAAQAVVVPQPPAPAAPAPVISPVPETPAPAPAPTVAVPAPTLAPNDPATNPTPSQP